MIGKEIHNLAKDLWPINRSITGDGFRKSLEIIKKIIPELSVCSLPSGTEVFDWTIPNEWRVNKAFILTPSGKKICDFSENNLHLVGYSSPFHGKITLDKLKKNLHTLPNQPSAIPYITSYYEERWGFCLSYDQYLSLEEGEYEVIIDTELFPGELNYGELIIPGRSEKEIFLSSCLCHPSMANNELSGPTVLTFISKWLNEKKDRHYTYRIIFIPETIGSISYLSQHYKEMQKSIVAGFNIVCIGDNRAYSYLPSRDGSTLSDRVAKHVMKWTDPNYISYSWLDRGSDERQYCSPGIDLPVACLMRSKFSAYPEYHTSLDNLNDVVTPEGLDGGYWVTRRALELLENNQKLKSISLGEPQMSKRGLYPTLSVKKRNERVSLLMNFLSFCDGKNDLLGIAELLNVPAWDLYELASELESNNLIIKV